jgi:hypothetical protein
MSTFGLRARISVGANQAVRAIVVCTFAVLSILARAQTTVGGHVGLVLPLVTWTNGQSSDLADNLNIGFPVGITVKGTGRTAFDFEFISSVQDDPRSVTLTVHPGFLWNVGHGFAPGIRAAFVVNSSQYGFTPLLNKSWPIKGKGQLIKAYFVEADLPVRFNRQAGAPGTSAVAFAMHFGLGF